MADPTLVLLILVAGAGADRPSPTVLGGGVREAFGGRARVLVEEREVAPSDAEARELAGRLKASAVAELRWTDDARSRARLHAFISADQNFHDREVTFAPADEPRERERALGLLVGAMVRAATGADDEPGTQPMPGPPTPSEDRPVRVSPSARGRSRWFVVDVGGTTATALGGPGAGIGAPPSAHSSTSFPLSPSEQVLQRGSDPSRGPTQTRQRRASVVGSLSGSSVEPSATRSRCMPGSRRWS